MKQFFLALSLGLILSCQPEVDHSAYIQSIEDFRIEYKEGFKQNDRAPLRTDEELALMDYYPPNPDYNVEARFEEDETKISFQMPTYSEVKKPYRVYGRLHFEVEGQPSTLTVYQNSQYADHPLYGKYLFLPFKDLTSGDETYGGGRYIEVSLDSLKGGSMMLDFNKCYNPWCAYSDGYSCPIPPMENHLNVTIEAGEKNYKGEYKYKD